MAATTAVQATEAAISKIQRAFATADPIAWPTRSLSFMRLMYGLFVAENLFVWPHKQGKRNVHADYEGPYYVIGAPDRTIAPGKVVMASLEEMRESIPFFLKIRVLSPSGVPVPNVEVDWWQAGPDGVYCFYAYKLRGKFRTDANGEFEVLTVPPGKYGPEKNKRAGHLHFVLEEAALADAKKDGAGAPELFDRLTTQVYVCRANNSAEMGSDFLNWFRAPRPGNMLDAWCVPSAAPAPRSDAIPASDGATHFMDLPAFDAAKDPETARTVAWWDAWLSEHGAGDLRVSAGGFKEIRLNPRSGWF